MSGSVTEIAGVLASRAQAVAEMLLPNGRKEDTEWRVGSTAGEKGQSLGVHHSGDKADGKLWHLFVQCRSAGHWTATKAWLSFCRVTQDGDDEGVLRLDRLPTKAEAAAIRKALATRQTGPAPANAFEFSSAMNLTCGSVMDAG